MQPIVTEWTVVVTGNWNPGIFSPTWVGQQLLNAEQIEAEATLSNQALAGLRLLSENAIVIPRPDRLVIGARRPTDEALALIEAATARALEILEHTPVTGLGINFGYREENPSEELLHIFDVSDRRGIADFGGELRRTEISREIGLEDGVLNFRVSLQDAHVEAHANFHHQIGNAREASQLLNGLVVQRRDSLLRLLSDVYGLELDEEVEE